MAESNWVNVPDQPAESGWTNVPDTPQASGNLPPPVGQIDEPPVPASDRADLLSAIQHASTTPATPTQWNKYETRSPQQVLQDELAKQDSNWVDVPDDRSTASNWVNVSDQPQAQDQQQQPEQAEAPTSFTSQLTGMAAGVADFAASMGQLAGGGMGGLALAAARGHLGDLNATTNDVKEVTSALGNFMPSKLANWIGGQDYTKTTAYQATQKPFEWLQEGTGYVGDKVLDATGSPLLATVADVGLQFGAMGVAGKMGARVFGKTEPVDLKANPEVVEQLRKNIVDQIGTVLDDATYQWNPGYKPMEGETWSQAFNRGFAENKSVKEMLEFLADADHSQLPEGTSDLQTLAKIYRTRAEEFGLDKSMTSVLQDMQKKTHADALYGNLVDAIVMASDPYRTGPAISAKDFMHEVGHQLTVGALDIWDKTRLPAIDPNYIDRRTLPAHIQDVMRVADDLNTIYNWTVNKLGQQFGGTGRDIIDVLSGMKQTPFSTPGFKAFKAAIAGKPFQEVYGFTNIKEFTTEVLNSKVFREKLATLDPSGLALKELGIPKANKSLWQTVVDGAKKILLGGTHSDTVGLAFDRAMNLVEGTDARIRANRLTDKPTINVSDTDIGLRTYQPPTGPYHGMTDVATTAQELAAKEQRIADFKANTKDRSVIAGLYQVAELLRKSATPDEFEVRARLLDSSKAWQDLITQKKDFLLDERNRQNIINHFGELSYWKDLSLAEKWETADPRGLDDFMKDHQQMVAAEYRRKGIPYDEGKVMLKSQYDIFDDLTFALGTSQLRMMKAKGPRALGGYIAKFLMEKGNFYNAMGAKLYDLAARRMQPYTDLGYTGKKNVMAHAIFWDSMEGRRTLQAAGLQWPTKEMLTQDRAAVKGLSEEEYTGYQGIADSMDYLHNLLNQALIKQGKDPVQQIPGYMPHFFDGAYRVLVNEIDGNNRKVVLVKGFQTRMGAMEFVKNLSDGKYDYENKLLRAQVDEGSGLPYTIKERQYKTMSLQESLSEQLMAYKNMNQLDPRTVARLERMEKDALRGTIKHLLDRSDIAGYLGDPTWNMGFHNGLLSALRLDPYNNRLLKMYDLYAKNVTEYYKNTMFMDEVAGPLFDSMPLKDGKPVWGQYLADAPKLKEYIGEYTSNFTGENFNHLYRFIEDEFRPILKWAGLDPELGGKFMMASRNFLSLAKLRGNIGFYLGNFIQPLHMLSILSYENEMLRQGGHSIKLHAPLTAFIKAFAPDPPEVVDAIMKARQEHIVDARLEYELRKKANNPVVDFFHKATLGNANLVIEYGARERSFAIAYHFFRDQYGDTPEAVQAAKQAMEMVNVNYDRADRPLMYQNFGIAGQSMSPFSVFRNAYIGNNLLMLQAMKSGKFHPLSMVPFLTYQTLYFTMAGAVGLVFAEEYDQLIKMWNDVLPEARLPRVDELAMKAQKAFGMSDAFTYGALSNATKHIPGLGEGVNIGPSMRASGLDTTLGTALSPFLDALARLGGLGLKAGAHAVAPDTFHGVSASDVYPQAKQLAPLPLQSIIERQMSANSRIVSKTTSPEGYVERTPAGWTSMDVFGKLSVSETARRAQEAIVTQQKKMDDAVLRDLVTKAVDSMLDRGSQMTASEAEQKAMNIPGMDKETWDKMVTEEAMKRFTTSREREAQQGGRGAISGARTREAIGNYNQ